MGPRSASNPDDTVIVSFSGHGDAIEGDSVLLPVDYAPGGQNPAVELDDVLKYLHDCGAI